MYKYHMNYTLTIWGSCHVRLNCDIIIIQARQREKWSEMSKLRVVVLDKKCDKKLSAWCDIGFQEICEMQERKDRLSKYVARKRGKKMV